MTYIEFEKHNSNDWIKKTFWGWKERYQNFYKENSLWSRPITPLECYGGGHMTRVNELLRTGHSSVDDNALCDFKNFLDNDFKFAPTVKDDIIVYRYIDKNVFDEISSGISPYIDRGFLSTTLNSKLYLENDFRLNYLDTDYILKIFVKKGTKALYVSGFENSVESEFELLFRRSSKLRKLKDAYYDNEIERNVLECELSD